jgi:mannose-6-phosphate isomerase-like protein (cupin superfamily)
VSNEPILLSNALASFDAVWRSRILTRVNDYDVRVPSVEGEHLWHVHDDTDDFFLVLGGEVHISLREPAGERTAVLPQGTFFTGTRGMEHEPYAPAGAVILMFEPTGTPTVGDRHDEISDQVDATIRHPLDS